MLARQLAFGAAVLVILILLTIAAHEAFAGGDLWLGCSFAAAMIYIALRMALAEDEPAR